MTSIIVTVSDCLHFPKGGVGKRANATSPNQRLYGLRRPVGRAAPGARAGVQCQHAPDGWVGCLIPTTPPPGKCLKKGGSRRVAQLPKKGARFVLWRASRHSEGEALPTRMCRPAAARFGGPLVKQLPPRWCWMVDAVRMAQGWRVVVARRGQCQPRRRLDACMRGLSSRLTLPPLPPRAACVRVSVGVSFVGAG